MTSTMVRLPDGSEVASDDAICEGCGESMTNHSCGGTAAPAAVVYSRSTGKRKDPRERPLCPHCNGPVHFSMPGGLQNTECIMRQFYAQNGTIADPFQRLPVWTVDDLVSAALWAKDAGRSYGRMESAAGGSGTYASLRPKTGRRKAGKGEKIEDVAKEMATPEIASVESVTGFDPMPIDAEPETSEPEPKAEPVVSDREARRARRRELLAAHGR